MIGQCRTPGNIAPQIVLAGDAGPVGVAHGALVRTGSGIAIDCMAECALTLNDCTPISFEIVPPLWSEWQPSSECYRFQWFGSGPESIDDLRVGLESEREQLFVGPGLHQLTLVHHQDDVRRAHRAETVRDDDARALE